MLKNCLVIDKIKFKNVDSIAVHFKWGFTWTFPRNQEITVKLKSELIFIEF